MQKDTHEDTATGFTKAYLTVGTVPSSLRV
jgi:hypothetical protein